MPASNGVVYIATDSLHYVRLAAVSAVSARKHLGCDKTLLYTDLKDAQDWSEFDEVRLIENLTPGGQTTPDFCEGPRYFRAKIDLLKRSPFVRSLYLDCDVVAERDADLFGLLDRFDIAVAHAPQRFSRWSRELDIPDSFPDFNVGLLLYRAGLHDFFDHWLTNYGLHPQPHDQTSFRKTVWESAVRVATLPPEFNRRPDKMNIGQELRIRHG